MPAKPKFKSDAFEAIHSSASGMFRAGTIDKATMRNFDEACLSVTPQFAPKDIQKLREANKVSQPVLRAISTPASLQLRNGRPGRSS